MKFRYHGKRCSLIPFDNDIDSYVSLIHFEYIYCYINMFTVAWYTPHMGDMIKRWLIYKWRKGAVTIATAMPASSPLAMPSTPHIKDYHRETQWLTLVNAVSVWLTSDVGGSFPAEGSWEINRLTHMFMYASRAKLAPGRHGSVGRASAFHPPCPRIGPWVGEKTNNKNNKNNLCH